MGDGLNSLNYAGSAADSIWVSSWCWQIAPKTMRSFGVWGADQAARARQFRFKSTIEQFYWLLTTLLDGAARAVWTASTAKENIMLIRVVVVLLTVALGATLVRAADSMDPKVQGKIDAAVKEVQGWASDPVIVEGVKAVNAGLSDDAKAMTQEKWTALALTDPFVRAFAKNGVAQFIKSKKGELITEAFVSAADGTKVAFLSKTTNWCHKGMAKHEDAMAGKTWQGPVEVSASTGVPRVQVSMPVKDGDKVIGSLVVGLNVNKLKD